MTLIEDVVSVVGEQVKFDEPLVKVITYVYFSRWTDNPLNLFLKGESSTGKTYVTRNTIEVLGNDKDVWWLGGLSPTSLVHEHGQLYVEGAPLNPAQAPSKLQIKMANPDWPPMKVEAEYREQLRSWNEKLKNSYYLVDLTGKLLILLESPSLETFDKLRPLLSHDRHEISYKFVEKTGKGQLRTTHVVLRGWPATIFMSTNEKYVADLSTRSITATPNLDEEKIRQALGVTADRYAFPKNKKNHNELETRIEKVKMMLRVAQGKLDVLIPYSRELKEYVKIYAHRVMRDFDHFLQLIKMNALVNIEDHDVNVIDGDVKYVLATFDDFYSALHAWKAVEPTTVTGVSGSALRVFEKLVKPTGPVTNYHMLVEKSRVVYAHPLSSSTLRRYVNVLQEVGLVDVEPDPEDKRRKVIRVIGEEKKMLKNEVTEFYGFFKLENLKAWWNELVKKCANIPLLDITLPVGVTINGEDEKLNYVYEKLNSISSRAFLHTILKPQNETENEKGVG